MPAKSLHILLIEDHEATGRALKIMLERRGHDVSVSTGGPQALGLVELLDFDLVISDLGLPDIDGWELLAQMRKQRPSLKAIALSGHGYAADFQRSREAGFDIHLTKPVQFQMVESAIAKLFPNGANRIDEPGLASERHPPADSSGDAAPPSA
jgi:CheY-like chemotaxis protein